MKGIVGPTLPGTPRRPRLTTDEAMAILTAELERILNLTVKPDPGDAAVQIAQRLNGARLSTAKRLQREQRRRERPDRTVAFNRLRAAGWPNRAAGRSKRRMARLLRVDKHTIDRWLENNGAIRLTEMAAPH